MKGESSKDFNSCTKCHNLFVLKKNLKKQFKSKSNLKAAKPKQFSNRKSSKGSLEFSRSESSKISNACTKCLKLFYLKGNMKKLHVKKNQSNSVLWQHSKASHKGLMKTSDWKIKITSSHTSALSRQVTEAVRISRESKASILNSKQEFGCNNIPELEVRYGIKVCNGGMKRKRKEDVITTTSILSSTSTPPEKDQGAVSPIVPEISEPDLPKEAAVVTTEMAAEDGPAASTSAGGVATGALTQVPDCRLGSPSGGPGDSSASVNSSSKDEDVTEPEPETPMPDRKKRRLLTRIPSRSIHTMSADELRDECRFWRLPVGGRKDILIRRLENNSNGQRILPFKLLVPQLKKDQPMTPSKRPRSQSSTNDDGCDDDASLEPSQKEFMLSRDYDYDDDDARKLDVKKEIRSKADELQPEVTTRPPPIVASNALQEDILPGPDIDILEGRAINVSLPF